MSIKIYKCNVCGEMIYEIKGNSNTLKCCGANMRNLECKEEDDLMEKHVPVLDEGFNSIKIKIGEDEHPMNYDHYIEWILLETNKGIRINYLRPLDKPETKFSLMKDEEVKNVYAYCNIHGLWKA